MKRVCWLLLAHVLCFLIPALPSHCEEPLQHILDSYRASIGWSENAAYSVSSDGGNVGFNDEFQGKSKLKVLRSDSLTVWQEETQFTNKRGEEVPDMASGRVNISDADGNWHYANLRKHDSPYAGVLYASQDGIAERDLLDFTYAPNGGFLDGKVDGCSNLSIAELLTQAFENGTLRELEDHSVAGRECKVLEATTPYGIVTVKISIPLGGNVLEYSIKKGQDDRYDAQTLAQMGLASWEVVVDGIVIQEVGNHQIIAQGTLSKSVHDNDGNITGTKLTVLREGVEFNPELASDSLAESYFPEGTIFGDTRFPGMAYVKEGGQVRPAIDNQVLDAVSHELSELKALTSASDQGSAESAASGKTETDVGRAVQNASMSTAIAVGLTSLIVACCIFYSRRARSLRKGAGGK